MISLLKSECLFDWHLGSIQSHREGGNFQTKLPRPFAHCGLAPEGLQTTIAPPIICLLHHCRPPAIAGLIVAVDLIAFEGELGTRSRTHVGQEILEGIPPLTNRDSSAAIVLECQGVRIVAARFHRGPDSMLRESRESMRTIRIACALPLKASARSCRTLFERAPHHLGRRPAIAPTKPTALPVALGADPHCDLGFDHQPAKALTRQIYNFSAHGGILPPLNWNEKE